MGGQVAYIFRETRMVLFGSEDLPKRACTGRWNNVNLLTSSMSAGKYASTLDSEVFKPGYRSPVRKSFDSDPRYEPYLLIV